MLDKTNVRKNALFFSFALQLITVFLFLQFLQFYNFLQFLQILYELKHKVHLSKNVCGIFHYRFHFAFIKFYILAQQKAWTL